MVSTWAVVNLLISHVSDGFQVLTFYERKSKGFGSIWMIFLHFCKILVPQSEEPPFTHYQTTKCI